MGESVRNSSQGVTVIIVTQDQGRVQLQSEAIEEFARKCSWGHLSEVLSHPHQKRPSDIKAVWRNTCQGANTPGDPLPMHPHAYHKREGCLTGPCLVLQMKIQTDRDEVLQRSFDDNLRGSVLVPVVVSVRNNLHRLVQLNTWSPVGGVFQREYETLRRDSLAEGSTSLWESFEG